MPSTATATATDQKTCVLYARISKDVRGESLGVTRQLEAGRAYAAARNRLITMQGVVGVGIRQFPAVIWRCSW